MAEVGDKAFAIWTERDIEYVYEERLDEPFGPIAKMPQKLWDLIRERVEKRFDGSRDAEWHWVEQGIVWGKELYDVLHESVEYYYD